MYVRCLRKLLCLPSARHAAWPGSPPHDPDCVGPAGSQRRYVLLRQPLASAAFTALLAAAALAVAPEILATMSCAASAAITSISVMADAVAAAISASARSEEHTYELQSLMRISYAVF